jgi:ubiquinone/menaquinone biosynthesis C-methylase UbiE
MDRALYDHIGSTYAGSRRADPVIAACLARELRLTADGAYLDVACGTGNYTQALSRQGGAWTGVDVSAVMLAQARQKSGHMVWVQASADALPFPDACFDGALCTLGIHHFSGLDRPFAQVRRTLRTGAFVIFTGLAEQMRAYWLCHYFPQMMARSIAKMPTQAQIRQALSRAGFASVNFTPFMVTNSLQDLFLYSGKHRPQLYLDDAIRSNISSFAQLTSTTELADGLDRLRHDLQTGAFSSVQARYEDSLGDYAVVTAELGV